MYYELNKNYLFTHNAFVKMRLDQIDINLSVNSLQKEVKSLQSTLKKMQQNGIVLYPKQGTTIDLYERTYSRMTSKKGRK